MKFFIRAAILLAICSFAVSSCSSQGSGSIPTDKKEVMDSFLAGTLDPSYVPAAFFIHFGEDEREGDAAVQAQLKYFLESNMDIMKIQFEQVAPRITGLDTPEGWDQMELMPVDFYRPTFEIINNIQQIVGRHAYVLPTLYNVVQIARQSLGDRRIIQGVTEHPEALAKLFDSYRDALIWLIEACKSAGIEGFYMCTQGGEMRLKDVPTFFDRFVKAYDLQVMGAASTGTKMNILHICDWVGTFESLTPYTDYPGQIVNTPIVLNGTPFSLQDGYELFGRPVLGGLDRQKEIISSPEAELLEVVNAAIESGPKGRMMLGAECTVSAAPLSNIQAAVDCAHHRAN